MKLTLAVKKTVVEEVANVASKAISVVAADYRGLTANQMTALRSEARKAGVYLRVVRNTLARKALQQTEFSCLTDALVGPVFIAFSLESPSDAARVLKGFTKTFEKLEIKALALNGKIYGPAQLDAIASLPTRDEALAKLMHVMKAPIEKFVRTCAEPYTKIVRVLSAIKDKNKE